MAISAHNILTLNAGSSSLKFALFETDTLSTTVAEKLSGTVDLMPESSHFLVKNTQQNILLDETFPSHTKILEARYNESLEKILQWLAQHKSEITIDAVGHRVVHGGADFYAPVVVDNIILEKLAALTPLAPLHQPYNLLAIRTLLQQKSKLFQVACFDTAFHRTLPVLAKTFALPENIADMPVERYGFHGLSYEYISTKMPDYMPDKQSNGRIIIAHLGHGASLCALNNRKSIATTMGFTALDGVPMGTRCGELDPGILLYLLSENRYTVDKLTTLLYKNSGLLGLSGISSDMRILLNHTSPKAKFTIDYFVYRVCREAGSLVAALNGLDALVFTAGIGENQAIIREKICAQLSWLGIKLSKKANEAHENIISTHDSAVGVYVIPTNEAQMIAAHTFKLLMKQQCAAD